MTSRRVGWSAFPTRDRRTVFQICQTCGTIASLTMQSLIPGMAPPQSQVSDKVGGRVPPHEVASLSLDDIRRGGAEGVKRKLLGLLLEGE